MICKVSFLPYDGQTFVSGFQLCHRNEHAGLRILDSVGYINHSHERSFLLRKPDSITKIDVVATASGIRGLRFHMRQDDGCSIEAIGYTDIQDSSAGMTSLASQGRILGLLIDFDVRIQFVPDLRQSYTDMSLNQACKAISIRLIEDTASSQPPSSAIYAPNHEPCLFWNPRPPDASGIRLIASTEPLQRTACFSIHLHMPFGGPSGSRLQHLSRVSALIHARTGFHGLAFSYDDGVEEMYGRRLVVSTFGELRCCVEQSFPIHGAAGERIIGCQVSLRDCTTTGKRIIRSLKVRVPPNYRDSLASGRFCTLFARPQCFDLLTTI